LNTVTDRLRSLTKKPTWRALIFWLLPAAFLGYFFYQPLLALFNLLISPDWGFKLSELDLNRLWQPLWFTTAQAALSTLLTLIIGLPGAWLFANYIFPGKKLLKILTTLPFILPTVVVAAGFNALLGPRGWLNLGLTISLGEFGASSFLTRPDYPTLPIAIFRYISQPGALNYGQALAMSTLLMIVCAGGIFIIEHIQATSKDWL